MLTAVLVLAIDLSRAIQGERFCAEPVLRTFYERRAMQPAWKPEAMAELLGAIDRLADEGLAPSRYHRDALARLPDGDDRDVLATDAFLTAAIHLAHGVVDPQFARPEWCPQPLSLDFAALLETALHENTVAESLARVGMQHEGYVRLRRALASYRAASWSAMPAGRTLRRGMSDPRVVDLRRRLAREPLSLDAASAPATGESPLFDNELEALVRHFQSHHAITVDGIVGPETLRELDVPAEERARQIAVNMERWRWLPPDPGASYVIVNIAAFRLDVIEGNRSVLTMKTVVGKDYTKTPFFAARIEEVIANPWWNVPDSIASKEIWPKQARNHSYLASQNMIVSGGRIRQRPGPWNALGRLKFNMPNGYNVYLHDTPARALFDRPFRAFSHGCIRLERPLALARYLLPSVDFEAAIAAGTERSFRIPTPEPVYVLYWTAWVGDDGHVEFHRDHYARDAAIAEAVR